MSDDVGKRVVSKGVFGDEFRITLVTNDPALAAAADAAGINRIGVDLEHLGKAERQAGLDTRLSRHTWEDMSRVARSLARSDLFVRINPLSAETPADVNTALDLGAKIVMLPFFRTADEVNVFVRLVRGRAHVILLFETAAAIVRVRDILAVPGVDEVMFGLNDLRLQLGAYNHFEVLVSPLMDFLAGEVQRRGLPLAADGIAQAHQCRPADPSRPRLVHPVPSPWSDRSLDRAFVPCRDFGGRGSHGRDPGHAQAT